MIIVALYHASLLPTNRFPWVSLVSDMPWLLLSFPPGTYSFPPLCVQVLHIVPNFVKIPSSSGAFHDIPAAL